MVNEARIIEAFGKIKEEMSDHLESINLNTNEINANADYIHHLELMIAKLAERVEQLELAQKHYHQPKEKILLNPKEFEIFQLLYERSGELFTLSRLAKSLGYTQPAIHKYVLAMEQKGIPIEKKVIEQSVFYILDPEFCNLQAKTKIVEM